MVNGRFPVNVIVHYFDKNQIEREAVIPTAFEKGASTYPIGMTMDIYEYQGKYGWDPDSVRDEILPGEQELMDDKPWILPASHDRRAVSELRCFLSGGSRIYRTLPVLRKLS